MTIKAEQKYIRMSSRKLRLVVDAIRDLTPKEALEQLAFMRRRAALPLSKTIKQAIANAVKNRNLSEENLRFESIIVGEGPTFKRWRAVSRGRAHQILKRTSHIKVLLKSEDEPLGKPAPAAKSAKAEVETEKKVPSRQRQTRRSSGRAAKTGKGKK